MVLVISTDFIEKIMLELHVKENGEKQVKDWREALLRKGQKEELEEE